MIKIKKTFCYMFIYIICITNILFAKNYTNTCMDAIGGSKSALKIFTNVIKSSYNILPIKIAGVKTKNFYDLEDYDIDSKEICICSNPFPRIGIPVEFWEPSAIIDVSSIPNCIPTLGASLPLNVVASESFGSIDKSNTRNTQSYQATYIKYPLFKMLDMFLDMVCLESNNAMDLVYLSSVDPLWQNDMWNIIANPDSFLFANKAAQLACNADSIAANKGFGIDSLYWCAGSWGSVYPFTKTTNGLSSSSSAALVATKILFKLHKQFVLWGSVGEKGMCGKYPMPIAKKSQYAMFPVFPIMNYPFRIPIGRSSMLWDEGLEIPGVNANIFSFIVYKKRNCCVF